jgi:hypothetical protein
VEVVVEVEEVEEEGEEVVGGMEGGKGVIGRTRTGTKLVKGTITVNGGTIRKWRGLVGRRKCIMGLYIHKKLEDAMYNVRDK